MPVFGKVERKKTTEKRRGRTTSSTAPKRARAHHQQPLMNLEEWYLQTPIVTRCYLTMSFLITAGCALEVKNNSFFLYAEHFSSSKNPIALQTRSRKKSGTDAFSRSLSLSFACRSSPRSRSTSTPTWSSKNINSGVWSPTFSSSALWV